MVDAFIIDKIKEEERRREDRRPQLRLPVYIDEGCEGEQGPRKDRNGDNDPESNKVLIDFS